MVCVISGAEGGHVLGVDVPAAGDELVDDRGEVHRGGVDGAVGGQLVELDEFFLVDGVVGGKDALLSPDTMNGHGWCVRRQAGRA